MDNSGNQTLDSKLTIAGYPFKDFDWEAESRKMFNDWFSDQNNSPDGNGANSEIEYYLPDITTMIDSSLTLEKATKKKTLKRYLKEAANEFPELYRSMIEYFKKPGRAKNVAIGVLEGLLAFYILVNMAENSMETQMHTGDAAYYKLGIAKLIAYYYLIADFGSRLASNKPVYRHSLRELRDITRESSNIP